MRVLTNMIRQVVKRRGSIERPDESPALFGGVAEQSTRARDAIAARNARACSVGGEGEVVLRATDLVTDHVTERHVEAHVGADSAEDDRDAVARPINHDSATQEVCAVWLSLSYILCERHRVPILVIAPQVGFRRASLGHCHRCPPGRWPARDVRRCLTPALRVRRGTAGRARS